jgi:hypothetical protein
MGNPFNSLTAIIGGTALVIILVGLVVLIFLWILMPFIIMRINSNLREILKQLVKMDKNIITMYMKSNPVDESHLPPPA